MPNRPPRLPGFKYLGSNRYFLTVCARSRARVFVDPGVGERVAQQFLRTADDHGFDVVAYCVMPDHFHALVAGTEGQAAFTRFVRMWKQVTGYWWKRQGHAMALWQEGYYETILRDDDPTAGVVRYIVGNPLRAGLVRDIHDYRLIGSSGFDIDALVASAIDWGPRRRRV